MPEPAVDRIVGVYAPDVPWVRAALVEIVRSIRNEERASVLVHIALLANPPVPVIPDWVYIDGEEYAEGYCQGYRVAIDRLTAALGEGIKA